MGRSQVLFNRSHGRRPGGRGGRGSTQAPSANQQQQQQQQQQKQQSRQHDAWRSKNTIHETDDDDDDEDSHVHDAEQQQNEYENDAVDEENENEELGDNLRLHPMLDHSPPPFYYPSSTAYYHRSDDDITEKPSSSLLSTTIPSLEHNSAWWPEAVVMKLSLLSISTRLRLPAHVVATFAEDDNAFILQTSDNDNDIMVKTQLQADPINWQQPFKTKEEQMPWKRESKMMSTTNHFIILENNHQQSVSTTQSHNADRPLPSSISSHADISETIVPDAVTRTDEITGNLAMTTSNTDANDHKQVDDDDDDDDDLDTWLDSVIS